MSAILLTHWGQEKNDHHFSDNILKVIFLNESCILIQISPEFVSNSSIDNN